MSQLDIAALVEAVCGAAGASGVWGVSAGGQCLLCTSQYQSLRCYRVLRFGACTSVALMLLGGGDSVLQAGSTGLATAVCLTTVHHTMAKSLHLTYILQCGCSFDNPPFNFIRSTTQFGPEGDDGFALKGLHHNPGCVKLQKCSSFCAGLLVRHGWQAG